MFLCFQVIPRKEGMNTKYFLPVVFLFLTQAAFANCFPVYEKESKRISDKKAYTVRVGDQLTIQNGQLGYDPGIEVAGKVDNWVRDYLEAIEWGANSIEKEDPRRDWLSALYKSVKRECPQADKNQYKILRSMLTELMKDGTLCPGDQVLKSTVLAPYASFKKALGSAVKDQRFVDLCQNKVVSNSSDRTTRKDTTSEASPVSKVKKGSEE